MAERTAELNQLVERLIADDEYFRQSFGQDIHDSLGQHMTGLLLYGGALKEQMRDLDARFIQQIEEIIDAIDHALLLTRRTSRTLLPLSKGAVELDAALDELIAFYKETTAVRFEFITYYFGC